MTRCSNVLLLFTICVAGCAGVMPENREAAFAYAVEQAQADRAEVAARAAWHYLQGASPEDPRYDRAQRLLARAAEDLGLRYASAQWYLDIAQGQREPELLPEAILGLKVIVESDAYDEDALVAGYLASAEITGLPENLQSFVSYQQGLHDARSLEATWSQDHFAKIPPESPYFHRARYVRTIEAIAARKLDEGIESLKELEKEKALPLDLQSDVRRSLARLLSSRSEFDEAIKRYEQLRAEAPGDPELLLEMAWVEYDRGDVRRALGLLLALDAPIYKSLIAPDRFLLEALALRRLCQFGPARQAAVRLRAKHGDALDDLYAGVPPMQSKALRAAARQRTSVRTMSAFLDSLVRERKRLEDLNLGDPLTAHLKSVYGGGLREARRQLESSLIGEVDALSSELLAAEEGVNLILHELGVGLLRGRKRTPGPAIAPAPIVDTSGHRTFLHFEGEFWTDELDDLIVVAEDRCID